MNDEAKAIYKDKDGKQFRYPVFRTPIGWKLSGTVDVLFYLTEPTAAGGLIEFVDYEICPAQRLRPADYIPYINSVRAMLPWPTKPANPPQVNTQPTDSRLHVEPRQPGQSSFRQLQEARAAQIDQERKARVEGRARAQQTVANPAKVAEARGINQGYASIRNRHGIKNQGD
jgi:hypothetical protein